jgi:hypothetical protein
VEDIGMKLRWKVQRSVEGAAAMAVPLREIERVVGRKVSSAGSFSFDGAVLPYFFHSYNNFGLTERSVEIPIVRNYLERAVYRNVLEIGNVTQHYYDYFREVLVDVNRTVVDKYEVGNGLVKADIAEFVSQERFDFAFSISTFEHMDSDLGRNISYRPGSSKLLSVAADNINHVGEMLMAEGGKLVVTAPLGYAPEWDRTFYSTTLAEDCGFSGVRRHVLRRAGELRWRQVHSEEGRTARDSSLSEFRHYVSILELDK